MKASCLFPPGLLAALIAGALPLAARSQSYEQVLPFPTLGERPLGSLAKTDDGDFLGTTLIGGTSGLGTIFKLTSGGTLSTLVDCILPAPFYPSGPLTKGADGKYYGVSNLGGGRNFGTVYRISSGGTLERLAAFAGTNGAFPQGRVAQGADGSIFGVASSSTGDGVVFKMTPAKVLSVVARFDAGTTGIIPDANVFNPNAFPFGAAAGLIKATDGNFYGVTPYGGANNQGTAFKVTPSGALSVVATFGGSNPGNAAGGLLQGADGNLYGTTATGGGANNAGTVFQITLGETPTLHVLAAFDGANGADPRAELIQDGAGVLYGVTFNGGANSRGTVFKVTVAGATGTIVKLADLTQATGFATVAGLAFGESGSLIGLSQFGGAAAGGAIFKLSNTNVLSTVADFGAVSGARLESGVTAGPDGALYGTTAAGGSVGPGTLYRLTTAGDLEKLGNFAARVSDEPLTAASDGKLYGTFTSTGAIFSATTAGSVSNVFSFPGASKLTPNGVIQASDGKFYGTTSRTDFATPLTIFRYSTADGLETLHTFDSAANGLSRLTEGPDGALYGTAATDLGAARGILFRITKAGEYKKLVTFKVSNGADPRGPLVVGPDRALYGTTQGGGVSGLGIIYRVTTAGVFKVLGSFNGLNGAYPVGGVVVGPGGHFYGTAQAGGGTGRYGTVFKATKAGAITLLKAFAGGGDGSFPVSPMIVGPDGNLYGTTYNTVFRLKTNNADPVAVDDNLTMPVINANVLRNDTDANKDPLRVTAVTQGAHGSVHLGADGKITYVPGGTFVNSDTFTYTITDPLGGTDDATVTISLPSNVLTAGLGGYTGVLALGGETRGYTGLAVVAGGVFTGTVYLDGVKTALKGKFAADGTFSKTVLRAGASPLVVNLTLDAGRNQIVGTIFDGTDTFPTALTRTFPAFSSTQPTPAAGRYTFLFPTATADLGKGDVPQGTGYASVTIAASGKVSLVGKTGDGSPFMAGSRVSHDNRFPLYVPLYAAKGYLAGVVEMTAQAGTDATGLFSWKKPPTGARYPNGFATSPRFLASRYVTGKPVLTLPAPPSNAKLVFSTLGLTKSLTISKANIVTVTNPAADATKVSINATTGTFSGRYKDGAVSRTFAGAIFQKGPAPRGEGAYLHAAATDVITLSAP